MNVWVSTSVTVLTIGILVVISAERMRAYRLNAYALNARDVAIGIAAAAASGWCAWRGIGGLGTSITLGVGAVAAVTDLRCGYVFDRVLLAAGIALVAVALARGHLPAALSGATAAAAVMAIPRAVSRGSGMGLGDVKLAGVLGLDLGPYDAIRALWFAFVIGAVVAIGCLAARRGSRRDALPFAPFLAVGAMVSAASAAS